MNSKKKVNDEEAKFMRCVDFLVCMVEKYGNLIRPATVEEIRELFPYHQCKRHSA